MIKSIIVIAALIEALIEYVKTVVHMVLEKEYKTAVTQGITILLGVLFAFALDFRVFQALSGSFEGFANVRPLVDVVLSGILASRGSNWLSDFFSSLLGIKELSPENLIGQLMAIREDGLGFDDDDEFEDNEEEGDIDGTPDYREA